MVVLYLNFQFLINFLTVLLPLSKSFNLKAGRKAVVVFRHLGKNTSRVTMVSSALWRKNVNGSRLVCGGFAGDSYIRTTRGELLSISFLCIVSVASSLTFFDGLWANEKMVSCVVPDCHNYSEKTGEAVSYHKFPQDHRTKAWLDRLRHVDMPPLENSYVCSEHFLPSCFRMDFRAQLMGEKVRKKLRDDAIPSLFKYGPEPKKVRDCNFTFIISTLR